MEYATREVANQDQAQANKRPQAGGTSVGSRAQTGSGVSGQYRINVNSQDEGIFENQPGMRRPQQAQPVQQVRQVAQNRPQNPAYFSDVNAPKNKNGDTISTPQYLSALKSEFKEIELELEGSRIQASTGMNPAEYAKVKMRDPQILSELAPLARPNPQSLGIAPELGYRGICKTVKKGFCGSSVIKSNAEVKLNQSGQFIVTPTDPGSKQHPFPFTGKFNNLKVGDLQAVLEAQKTPESRQKIGKNLEELVDPPNGDAKYLMGFGGDQADAHSRLYLYFKDDQEVNTFRNTFLTSSLEGQNFANDPKIKNVFTSLAQRHANGRRLYVLDAIKRTADAYEDEQKRKHPVKITTIPPEQREQRRLQAAAFIRRICIRTHIKREIKPMKSEEQRKKDACQRIMRNLASKDVDASKRFVLLKWRKNVQEMIDEQIRSNAASIVLSARKYYNLFADNENRADLNTLNIDELHIVVSQTKKTQEDIDGGSFHHHFHTDMLPLPLNSTVQTTEFRIVSHMGALDLTAFNGHWLICYIKNKEDRTITAIGSVRITPQLPEVIIVEMTNQSFKFNDNGQAYLVGAVAFKRDFVATEKPRDPEFCDLTRPKYFGFMKKLNSEITRDLGLGIISDPSGIGVRYTKIRNLLASDYNSNLKIAEYESEKYRLSEWTFFEDIISNINNVVVRKPEHEGVVIDTVTYVRLMKSSTGQDPYFTDNARKAYLYFAREHWRDSLEFAKNSDHIEKALVTGMPDWLYVPVWKSLGKVNIIKQLVIDIARQKIPGFQTNKSILDQLAEAGKDELSFNPNIEKDLNYIDKAYQFSPNQMLLLRKTLNAFLKFSLLMEDVSNDVGLNGLILKGFSLKSVGGLVSIVRHLMYLVSCTKRKVGLDERCKTVSDDDVFWVLMCISLVFLPEHFLSPLLNFQPQADTIELYKILSKLGISLDKFLKNKMFISNSAVGSYKLSIILAQCIRKDSPALYDKMTDLGFPFLTYCLDNSESMFSETLNGDTLSKLWNLIFFEGADLVKRRAQQIVLSSLVAIIKRSKDAILASRSSEEVLWHLKAHGEFNFEGTQFLSDVLKIRKNYFVNNNSNDSLFSKIQTMFQSVAGNKSIEEEFQEIKGEIADDLTNVMRSNGLFLDFIRRVANKVESENQIIDLLHIRNFLNSWEVKLSPEDSRFKLFFTDEINGLVYTLADKPQVQTVTFGISSWDLGNYIANNLKISIQTNFRRESIVMGPSDPQWYRLHTLDASMVQYLNQSWVEVQIDGIDRLGKSFSNIKRFTLDRIRFNKSNYFYFKYNTFWLVLHLKMTSTNIKTDEIDYFSQLDHDFQHRRELFCEAFADHMEIKKETPYKEEILNNSCTKSTMEAIITYAFRTRKMDIPADVDKGFIRNDIFNKGQGNLFETMVRFILFSPMNNQVIIRLLFILLSRLDLSSEQHKVKRSHVEFLIWYILRCSQIYLPYVEVVSTVSTLLHQSDSNIISAVITSLDDSRRVSLDITEIMNLWFVAERRRTGRSMIRIGQKGYLHLLAKAIKFWQAEYKQTSHVFSKVNRLRLYVNCSGMARRIEFKFDDTMRIIYDNKDRDFVVDGDQVILLEDTEESLSFSQFSDVLARFQILDYIFSRLTGIGNDASHVKFQRDNQMNNLSQAKNFEVLVKFRATENTTNGSEEGKAHDMALVHCIKMAHMRLIDYSLDETRFDYLIDNQNNMNFGGTIPNVADFGVLTPEISLRKIIEDSLQIARNFLIEAVTLNEYKFPYKQGCLNLLSASLEDAKISIQDKKLNPEHVDAALAKISRILSDPAKIHITVDIRLKDIPPIYNHMAKDIYYLEGVDVVQNPLAPCQVLSKNSTFAEVLFCNDNGKLALTLERRLVPLDDIVLSNN